MINYVTLERQVFKWVYPILFQKKIKPQKKKKSIFSLYVNYKDWLKEQQKNQEEMLILKANTYLDALHQGLHSLIHLTPTTILWSCYYCYPIFSKNKLKPKWVK